VFDEGTSALDNPTERELVSVLHRLRGDPMRIMVAHWLSTVRKAEEVFVMERRRIGNCVSNREFAARSLAFQRLVGG